MIIKIFLPTHNANIIYDLAHDLTNIFGGCTVYQNCKGFWKNKKEIEVDNITIIEIFTDKSHLSIESRKLLMEIKRKLNQKLIAYSIDNDMFFL